MLFCKKYFFYTIILKTVKIMKKIVLNFFFKDETQTSHTVCISHIALSSISLETTKSATQDL